MKTVVFIAVLLLTSDYVLAQEVAGGKQPDAGTLRWNAADSLEAVAAISTFQQNLNDEYKDPKTSPLGPDVLPVFQRHEFFPVDLRYRVRARLEVTPGTPYFAMKTTTRRYSTERVYGYLNFTLAGKEFRLPVYQSQELLQMPEYADYLFFPFIDETNGTDTYANGRYIDLRIPKLGDSLIVDFNMAYNPYCAYQSKYSCPLVPSENRIDIPVRAGVMYNSELKNDPPRRTGQYQQVDVVPEYPGGMENLIVLMKKNLKYPRAAKRKRIEGTVIVQFTVEADGTVTNIKTIEGISRECDREAERLIGLTGTWKPGQFNGQDVPVTISVPFNFVLSSP